MAVLEAENATSEERAKAEEVESLKQEDRRRRLQNFTGVNQAGVNKASQDAGKFATGAANEWGSNQIAEKGAQAGKLAEKAAKMGGGSEAAVAGAVAGTLRGEGAGGVIKSAGSALWLWYVFGFVVIGVITSPTVAGIFLALIAVGYLDFHFIMSHWGFKWFGPMNFPQKITLALANLLVFIITLVPLAIFGGAIAVACQGGSAVTQYMPMGTGPALEWVAAKVCQPSPPAVSSAIVGDSASSILVNIPQQYISMGNFGDPVNDYPRVQFEQLYLIEKVFQIAAQKGIIDASKGWNIRVTSALRRPGGRFAYSCHMLGEATDFVLIPPPNSMIDQRIDLLVAAVREAGAGFVQDEYRRPSPGATGAHVHMGLGGDPNCVGREGEIPPASEFYMPY